MRNLKKFLALVLSMMMVLSLVVTASAVSIKSDGDEQKFNDTADANFKTAIEVLNGMDVLKGDANPATGEVTGNFRPTDSITRAEVAALVFRLTTGKTGVNDANHYAQYGNFSDVKDDAWYAGYVGYCANAGYIKGYAGEYGPFGPTDPVTGYQALAMILRAMGYGVNGEFEGSNWMLNVSATGTQNGVLSTITSSNYGEATLRQAAQRQVVAEIFFQAIQKPCVVYTPAFGYQTTNVNSGTNASVTDAGDTAKLTLGRRYFGLVGETRIILGNQATGEDYTRVGDVTGNGSWAYEYPGVDLWDTTDPDNPVFIRTTAGYDLNVNTGIEMFGHKVKVYFDKDWVKSGEANRVYAIYDMADEKIVYAKDDDLLGNLGEAAASAKMAVNKRATAYISDRYDRITRGVDMTAADFAAVDDTYFLGMVDSTIKEDRGDDAVFPYGLADSNGTVHGTYPEAGGFFKLIDNDQDGVLDVVITLAPELARITEHNTTASVNTLRLSGKSDVAIGNGDFISKPSTFGESDNGVIRMGSLTDSSEKGLGQLVVAWEIKGTNYTTTWDKKVTKGNSDMYFYQLDKVATPYKGVVKTYNPNNGTVTLMDGKTLSFTRLPIINDAVLRPADDEPDHNSNLYFYNGVEYTFLLDPTDSSRYVDYEQGDDYKFLYSVYADTNIGNLGTAELGYVVNGVDWDGNIHYVQPFTTIDQARVIGSAYEALTITKKNLGGASNTVGNEIQSGIYTGYGYNATTKDLDTVVNGYEKNYWDGQLVSLMDNEEGTDGVWEITSRDVADGWSEQTANWRDTYGAISSQTGRLLLTPNTKFIVVDGLGVEGSANPVSRKIYNGIGEFLDGHSWVTVDVNRYGTDAQKADLNVYFKVNVDPYNNFYKDHTGVNYSDDNRMADVVILPASAVTWSDSNNLWFTNRANSTGQLPANIHADSDTVAEYILWQNGVEKRVYVDWYQSTNKVGQTMGNVNNFVEDTDVGMFFELTVIGATYHGDPIYKAIAMGADGGTVAMDNVYVTDNANTVCNTNLDYEYTAVNNTSTARLRQRTDHTVNYADGDAGADVYNVSNAKVVDLTGTGLSGDNVLKLNNAVSIGYDITVAIVNNGHSVTLIYVTDVDATNVVR